jgi:hypothetical protein
MTHTRKATASSAAVLPSAPSWSGRSSFSVIPSAATQAMLKRKKPNQVSATQPTDDQNRAARRPNCRARGRDARRANRTALPTSAASWITVAAISTPGGRSSMSAPAAPAIAPMTM